MVDSEGQGSDIWFGGWADDPDKVLVEEGRLRKPPQGSAPGYLGAAGSSSVGRIWENLYSS